MASSSAMWRNSVEQAGRCSSVRENAKSESACQDISPSKPILKWWPIKNKRSRQIWLREDRRKEFLCRSHNKNRMCGAKESSYLQRCERNDHGAVAAAATGNPRCLRSSARKKSGSS